MDEENSDKEVMEGKRRWAPLKWGREGGGKKVWEG